MGIVHISFSKTRHPDFAGSHVFVPQGEHFDARKYAATHGFESCEFDAHDLRTAEEAIVDLDKGEWLDISHYVVTDD